MTQSDACRTNNDRICFPRPSDLIILHPNVGSGGAEKHATIVTATRALSGTKRKLSGGGVQVQYQGHGVGGSQLQ